MDDDAVRSVLRTILSCGSVLGARLRPLLVDEFRRATRRDLEPVLKSFGKFSAFLAANADLVDVHSDNSGDIRVSLKAVETSQAPAPGSTRRLSRDLWQAFTNPDERRRRFYHRDTREVLHYMDGSAEGIDKSLALRVSSDDRFVEIEFAHAQDQNGWMREFLDSTRGLSDSTRRVAGHLVGVPYESSVNWAFASALGAYGQAWRRFRSIKVSDRVERWAEKNSIVLEPDVSEPAAGISPTSLGGVGLSTTPVDAEELRSGLQSAIRSMNARELAQVLVPASVCARIWRLRSGE